MSLDIQFGAAVIVILLGLGMTQLEGGQNEFILGAAWGTLAIGCIWIGIRVRKEYKKR